MDYRDQIERAMRAKGLSAAETSRRAGGNKWLVYGIRRGGTTTVESLQKLCEVLDLDFYVGPPARQQPNDDSTRSMGVPTAALDSVPAVNMAICDPRGWAEMQTTNIRVRAPIQIPDADAFAVIVSGHSMRPAGILPGSICFCSPAVAPATEDIVCVQRQRAADGPVEIGIKLLNAQRVANIDVIAYGPAKKHADGRGYQDILWDTVPRAEITSIATVVHISRRPTVTV